MAPTENPPGTTRKPTPTPAITLRSARARPMASASRGAIAASAGLTNDGYVDISTTTNGASIKTLSGNGTLNLGDRTLTLTAANDEFAGNIFGAGNVVVNAGTQTFSGLNDYTGKTTVLTGATLNLNKINAIAKSSLVNVDGVLDLTTSGGQAAHGDAFEDIVTFQRRAYAARTSTRTNLRSKTELTKARYSHQC
jgi:autotransporter-associated beta strand protein